MKNYAVNNFKAINYQYAVGQILPIWGDLEGWDLHRCGLALFCSILFLNSFNFYAIFFIC